MRFGLESLGLLLIRIVIALGAISIAAPEMAFANDWDSTNLSADSLNEFINTKNCYKNPDEFLGCIAALNAILATVDKTLSNNEIKNLDEMKETSQNLGSIEIKHYKKNLVDFKSAASWNKFQTTNQYINKSWKKIYFATVTQHLSIEKILADVQRHAGTLEKFEIGNAINAYYSVSIDPHTKIQPQITWDQTYANSDEKLVGAGVYIRKMNDQYILQPMEDGTAQKSGIKNLDALVKVDGNEVINLEQQQVVGMIRGEENSVVTLTVQRKNQLVDIKIHRAAYSVKNVQSQILSDPLRTNRKIGYVKIARFNVTGVCSQFINAANSLRAQGAESLILDLRSNGGGSVSEATCIASQFLDKGRIIITKNDPVTGKVLPVDGTYRSNQDAPMYHAFGNKPVVILQNSDTASASELLIGSLAVDGRAITVGERSYGKGTMQLSQDSFIKTLFTGVKMMKTEARFHFANNTSNQLHGIKADILAHSKPNSTAADEFALREADLYANAIIAAKAPIQFPKNGTDAIQKCIKARNAISREYSNPNSEVALDYQLLIAREVASCRLGQ